MNYELQLLENKLRLHCCSREEVILHTLQDICEFRHEGISMIAVSPIQSVSSQRKVRKQKKISKTAEIKDQKEWLGRKNM